VRSMVAEAFLGAMIVKGSDLAAGSLGKVSERSAFWQVLADEAVGVFVGAAFPRVMRSGEVDLGFTARRA